MPSAGGSGETAEAQGCGQGGKSIPRRGQPAQGPGRPGSPELLGQTALRPAPSLGLAGGTYTFNISLPACKTWGLSGAE